MNKLLLTIMLLISTRAFGQGTPAYPIPATPESAGKSLVDFINLERHKTGLSVLQYSDQLTYP